MTVRRKTTTGVDSFGTPTVGFVDEEVPVFAWYRAGVDKPGEITPERVEYDATVYPPADTRIADGDRVILPNVGEYEVTGAPENYDDNSWWSPGLIVVRLKRVDG